jgi:hypothetical protein
MFGISKTTITLLIALLIVNITSKTTCPKYTCAKGIEESCAFVKSNKTANSVTLTDTCKPGQHCAVPPPQWHTLATTDNNIFYVCEDTTIPAISRYPGEECQHDADCFKSWKGTGKCINNVCDGKKEGEKCDNTADCWKGLYCNKQEWQCVKQVPFGGDCGTSEQCENKVLCHPRQDKCILMPYSVEPGNTTSKVDPWASHYCKLVYQDPSGWCSTIEQKVSKGEDVVKCNLGSKCSYTDTIGHFSFTRDCECGYNADGQGYCPKAHNLSKISFNFRW